MMKTSNNLTTQMSEIFEVIKETLLKKDTRFSENLLMLIGDITETNQDPKTWFFEKNLIEMIDISMEYVSTLNIANVFLYTQYNYNEVCDKLVDLLTIDTNKMLYPAGYSALLIDKTAKDSLKEILENNQHLTTMVLVYTIFKINN